MDHLLSVIISQAKVKDALGPKFLQPFVDIFSHRVVVFVRLVAQSKNLQPEDNRQEKESNINFDQRKKSK